MTPIAHKYELGGFCSRSNLGTNADKLKTVLDALPKLDYEKGPWLAGGAVRRTTTGEDPLESDFDIFFASQEQCTSFINELTNKGAELKKKKDFNHDFRFKIGKDERKVQAIHFQFYANADEVIDSFDFTCCQFITDGTTLVVSQFAVFDTLRKRLAMHRITYATDSMRRMIKYAKAGYYACPGMMANFLQEVIRRPDTVRQVDTYID